MKKIKIIFAVLFITVVMLSASLVAYTFYQMKQPLNISSTQLLTIKDGTSFSRFSEQLIKEGWLNTRFWMRNYVRLKPEYANIKAGTYQINKDISVEGLLVQLVAGKEHQFTVTFIEGTTFKEWLVQLSETDNLVHTLQQSSVADIASKLNIEHVNPEGLFYPETYAFTAGTTDIELLKRAQQQMFVELNLAWQNRAEPLPYKNKYQALIMASIIEKESGKNAEHGIISSVFVNRLNKKMRLQTDPTVIYGLGERYQGDIKYRHLREKTPYNTYRINGLPPTPIAMPGKSAIHAALNPLTTDYLYFVSNGNGQHIFSTNLKDHNAAVTKYQLN
ncbi:endolytic transglycosylase MltG [Colwellia hornerae]|uniref:Endolytic murein transglycosylase n=1 Tax=Colwellia hornerae TaxID=89402 RepID=A0A5C6QS57_9GAMM|nr:endolytic transglycosylase MltG [Colwellia hornerae]TWX57606.1 endolytic transglycosylase MltG [Colwellia hornerae]TWX62663.1 endolytic transglycosylase MltG [Colwellia hornerae]TWX71573.1 endolytic transglycosylase MltG [Colwellia hornerae]